MSATMRRREVVFVLFLVIGPIVGYLIGNPKGYGVLGAVLGFFLGFIGWIIMAVIPAKR
ncbi:MAG: hypothetical protein ABJH68_06030 [Ilumatobacter sp.]|uniref:hypothetical protein n=1 Tax=Ilumatobacter sp. TaxID=1967498 RepID=UPI003296836A